MGESLAGLALVKQDHEEKLICNRLTGHSRCLTAIDKLKCPGMPVGCCSRQNKNALPGKRQAASIAIQKKKNEVMGGYMFPNVGVAQPT
ncbi:MAG: hypothetical protein A2648_02450 [Candidatus Lloydbacteria bacterium RIFCSPHIGHO2_01_FULL_41_20]|uniref:Uncharacterized protein n=1 Tax=Candidatus Lloydbacteria bacterium RIFCSPHIGHO2_01_FULL_41_20 TaxID=1798657 RepID=A0A1G2CRF9_9BACT|nr:MAG: hypothetical protein A2648_02450 [Candidatus Lloydbacteria bacterium RIFCSPHIGHO2_01_FULL_41_20]